MRLDRVYIDGFKNLNAVEADFDERRLTTVLIGENGAGKSNLLEAIVDVFRFVDLDRGRPRYKYEIEYRIGNHKVRLSNRSGQAMVVADGNSLTRAAFEREKSSLFPDLVFGYYSGGGRRMEKLFDSHQRGYYDKIKINDDPKECRQALLDRRLFYCRPIHGIFALLSSFAFPDFAVSELLKDQVGILEVFIRLWLSLRSLGMPRVDRRQSWRPPVISGAPKVRLVFAQEQFGNRRSIRCASKVMGLTTTVTSNRRRPSSRAICATRRSWLASAKRIPTIRICSRA